jgi:hypothetical protein
MSARKYYSCSHGRIHTEGWVTTDIEVRAGSAISVSESRQGMPWDSDTNWCGGQKIMVGSKKITNWIYRNDVHALIEHRLEDLGIRCQNTDWDEKQLVALTMVPNLVSSSEAPTTANDGAERNNSFLLSTSRDAFDAAHNSDTTKSRANVEMGEGICRNF